MQPVRELLRLARRLHTIYQARFSHFASDCRSDWERLAMRYQQSLRQRRLVEIAHSRGWQLAAQKHQEQLAAVLRSLSDAATKMREQWHEYPPEVPRLNDLLAELRHLEMEFGEIFLERSSKSIAVKTDSIVLEGVELGPFQIGLQWDRLLGTLGASCFEVAALEPNPAGNDRSVTHPHVKNDGLCAGEATIPIQKALEQGRLVDAFCLIRSVLETYNGSSAYTTLENWNGVTCASCGYTPDGEDVHFCERCNHDVCDDCTSSCEQCDRTFCASCQTRCDVCDSPCCIRCLKTSECSETRCCANCLKVCSTCGAKIASSELDDETERCPTCRDEATEDEDGVETSQDEESVSEPSPL